MDYTDPYNFPENAIREYDVAGGSVTPDLFNGTIFRVSSEDNFTIERLRNQIDGAKFFIEVYNPSDSPIYVEFDSDYRGTNLEVASPGLVNSYGVCYYEGICRIGLMLLYNQIASPGHLLLNPLDMSSLINPSTGQTLLNPE